MSDIHYIDNSALVLAELASVKSAALASLGAAAVGFARMTVPVRTGRLRDSIGYALTGDDAVSVGSGVDYAAYVEFGTLGRPGSHFLRDAMALHTDEYAAMLTELLSGAAVTEADADAVTETVTDADAKTDAKGGEKNGSDETKETSGKAR